MDGIFHEKEEEGVFYGAFTYLTEGLFAGSFEGKCSQSCVNMLLQKSKFVEGIAVVMDDQALSQAIDSLHIKNYFGLTQLSQMENLFLLNWGKDQLEVFGSLLAMYQVLKAEGLTLLPFTASLHPSVAAATSSPESIKGYLFMLEDHWLVLRRINKQWYKFDPWLTGAQLLNDFYVSLYIKQLLADGKLVFLVDGDFPKSPAEELGEKLEEEVIPEDSQDDGKLSLDMSEQDLQESLRFLDLVFENEDNELALALLLSLEDDIRLKKERESVQGQCSSSQAAQVPSTSCLQAVVSGSERAEASVVCNVLDGTSDPRAKRKNGTAINPADKMLHDYCSDFDDLCDPFSFMFDEPGEGSLCLTTPSLTHGSLSDVRNIASTSSASMSSQAVSTPAQTQPTPKVFITTSDKSDFKKVLTEHNSQTDDSNNEETMCCVCWASPPSHVVVPCGHYCLCANCSISLQQPSNSICCPLCKQTSSAIIRIYM